MEAFFFARPGESAASSEERCDASRIDIGPSWVDLSGSLANLCDQNSRRPKEAGKCCLAGAGLRTGEEREEAPVRGSLGFPLRLLVNEKNVFRYLT